MRILIVYPYVPWPLDRGTFHRLFNLARELSRRGDVDLFCLAGPSADQHLPVFREFCGRVEFHAFRNPPWAKLFPERLLDPTPSSVTHWRQSDVMPALEKFIAGQKYDLVHFCDLAMWPYVSQINGGALQVMDRSRVDLLFQREELAILPFSRKERWLRRENLWKLARYEKRAARALAATVVCGPDDETFSRRHIIANARIKVLANGVDEAFFDREKYPPSPAPEPTVLFCGAMDYSPNVSGVQWYFRECDARLLREIPSRRIIVAGKNPLPEVRALAQIPGVTVTGEVPDVRPYYQRAWAQMVPLLIGGGTRLKIVESLALGTPVVSTTIGAQGLDFSDREHLLLADEPLRFADALAEILRDADLRGRLADSGRRQVLARYTWRRLGAELSDFYADLQKGHHHD